MDRRTILTVEDQPNIRRLIAYVLTKAGYKVMQAEDGEAAVHVLQRHVPDLILLDVRMPKMDGFELLSLLRKYEAAASIPVVILTSLNTPRDLDRALELGVIEYLTKPIEPKTLMRRVNEILGGPLTAEPTPPGRQPTD